MSDISDIADHVRNPKFDAAYIQEFIEDFSRCESDPVDWIEDRGVGENYKYKLIDSELMRELCRAWVRDPMSIYAVCGTMFWETMKELASEVYNAR